MKSLKVLFEFIDWFEVVFTGNQAVEVGHLNFFLQWRRIPLTDPPVLSFLAEFKIFEVIVNQAFEVSLLALKLNFTKNK